MHGRHLKHHRDRVNLLQLDHRARRLHKGALVGHLLGDDAIKGRTNHRVAHGDVDDAGLRLGSLHRQASRLAAGVGLLHIGRGDDPLLVELFGTRALTVGLRRLGAGELPLHLHRIQVPGRLTGIELGDRVARLHAVAPVHQHLQDAARRVGCHHGRARRLHFARHHHILRELTLGHSDRGDRGGRACGLRGWLIDGGCGRLRAGGEGDQTKERSESDSAVHALPSSKERARGSEFGALRNVGPKGCQPVG